MLLLLFDWIAVRFFVPSVVVFLVLLMMFVAVVEMTVEEVVYVNGSYGLPSCLSLLLLLLFLFLSLFAFLLLLLCFFVVVCLFVVALFVCCCLLLFCYCFCREISRFLTCLPIYVYK